jgi:hypothetical protein
MRRWTIATMGLAAALAGCAGSKPADRSGWAGQPLRALDGHPYLATLPMLRTPGTTGGETRTYQSRANTYQCYTEANVRSGDLLSQATHAQVLACTSRSSGCDHVFGVRDGQVTGYTTEGRLLDKGSCAERAKPGG